MERPLEDVVGEIRADHRARCFAMELRKAVDLKLGQFIRLQLGWRKSLPDKERNAIADQADRLIEIGEAIEKAKADYAKKRAKALANGGGHDLEPRPAVDGELDPLFEQHADIILATIQARAPFNTIEEKRVKVMEKAAKELPVYQEVKDTPGLKGGLSLAIIIAESATEQEDGRLGTLSDYPTHSKLWKRMGVAFMDDDGVRQGGLLKTASKEDWIRHGYSRNRRSRIWTIGDSLVKAAGPYREVYLARKEYERRKAEEAGLIVAPSAKIPKSKHALYRSDGHIHRRAQRFMEKKLLRDLWKAWRRSTVLVAEKPVHGLPAAGAKRERSNLAVAAKPMGHLPAPSSPTSERWMDHG